MISRRGLLAGLGAMPLLAGRAAGEGGAASQAGAAKPELLIGPGQKLVIIGDSITDADRKRPVGEGLFDAIGKGYVAKVDALLGTVYPDYAIRVVNMGISGNTVRDLRSRWQDDVTALKPDWVAIMIGANDVWRQFDLPRQKEIHVPIDEYERTLDGLVGETLAGAKGVVLMTPFYIEPNPKDAMRARMDEYGAAVRRIAGARRLPLVDTQAAFDRVLEYYYPATIAWDRIHPNHIGQMVLARAFVDAIGFDWDRTPPRR